MSRPLPTQADGRGRGNAQRRIDCVLSSVRLRVTNAKTEAINAKIQWIKYLARGYRSMKSFITAIYFHCGGLNMDPLASST